MAACSSLDHIFDKPLPENPTLLESLSPWKHLKSVKHNLEDSNYTEIFGELHFKENNSNNHVLQSSPSTPKILQEIGNEMVMEENNDSPDKKASFFPIRKQYRQSDGFSSMNSESLSLCTEGLGFESSDDVEELKNENNYYSDSQSHHHQEKSKRSRANKGSFPPPISCIGRTGKPWVYFKSYREDGRFILQEIRIPTQESLHASREDGRLKLQFIQSDDDDEILEGDEADEDDGSASDDFGEINCEENGQTKVERLSSNNVGVGG